VPDYDVAILALVEPESTSPVATYRPTISVRNNGTHPATVSGTIRAYNPAGELAYTSGLVSRTLEPGQTASMLAASLWTPANAGLYSVSADIVCDRDEVQSNNHLASVPLTITGAAAPPTAEHGNEAHDPDFLSDGDLDAHAAAQADVHGYDAHGDLGIGGIPEDRALLDLQSTTKALIVPRLTTVQRNAVIPPSAGMVVFDTTIQKLCVYTDPLGPLAGWEVIQSAP